MFSEKEKFIGINLILGDEIMKKFWDSIKTYKDDEDGVLFTPHMGKYVDVNGILNDLIEYGLIEPTLPGREGYYKFTELGKNIKKMNFRDKLFFQDEYINNIS